MTHFNGRVKRSRHWAKRRSPQELADIFAKAVDTADTVKPYNIVAALPSSSPPASSGTPVDHQPVAAVHNEGPISHPLLAHSPSPPTPHQQPLPEHGGMQDFLRALGQDRAQTARHAQYHWYFIIAALSLFVVCRLIAKVDAKLARKRCRGRASSFTLGRSTFIIDDEETTKPALYERLFRAAVAFIRKSFAMVDVLFLRLTLAELIIVAIYISAMFILVSVDNTNIPAGSVLPFTVHGIGNRASKLALSSLPLQIALASKNNIITFLTGVPFDRLIFLHRWVGRMTIILAVMHSWTKLRENHTFHSATDFRVYGVAAFTMALCILLTAHRWSMILAYEVFTTLHVLFVVSFIGLVWAHRPSQRNWLIASLCLWGSDRIFRLLRIVINNGLWRLTSNSKRRVPASTATVRPLSNDTVRVEVFQPDFPSWTPGSYAYLSTPALSWMSQAHPFTIASCPPQDKNVYARQAGKRRNCGAFSQSGMSEGGVSDKDEFGMYDLDGSKDGHAMSISTEHGQASIRPPRPNLIFIIRARGGWTRRLLELALRGGKPSIPLLVDGPYPSLTPLHRYYDTIVLFAGGAGVSWTLPILMDLIIKVRRGEALVRSIIWVWTIRHYVNYEWFYSELERIAPLAANLVDLRVHYTTNTAFEPGPTGQPPFFRAGRPDIADIIHTAVFRASGRIFVGVSGPAAPADEVRRVTRALTSPRAILRGDAKGDIHFHRELFGW